VRDVAAAAARRLEQAAHALYDAGQLLVDDDDLETAFTTLCAGLSQTASGLADHLTEDGTI
jgi:hypothetical protein